ncbi:M91 family zinc metallopeptidase [Phytomonospora endophytica]|uniref:Uncharacterized protein YukE n=1 Tax=Phytomonospora endophytica TaxID=714109 RepID=A0A841G4Y7_9ACTN|nr:M91 family zinc metallopeptidase [Phytomonospora endophytica]MBB6039170.1 uncharacterized protein YukE [Phytomonospora endophytica]GIG67593.1 hypothetical protein Pen01_38880 [Phytomonospora endophytica]
MTTAQTVFHTQVPLSTWSLEAEPGLLDQAASNWRAIGSTVDREAERLNGEAAKLFDNDWAGLSREQYERHVKSLRDSMAGTKGIADAAATVLTELAGDLRDTQAGLTDSLGALMGRVEFTIAGSVIEFRTRDAAQEELVRQGVRDAEATTSSLDARLRSAAATVREVRTRFEDVSDRWHPYAGDGVPFAMPPEAVRASQVLYLPDGSVIINTGGARNDRVVVDTDGKGRTFIEINGVRIPIVGSDVTVRTGDGDDTVTVKTDAPVTALTGAGDDSVTTDSDSAGHVVLSGGGDDKVKTGDGPSYVASGGGDDKVETGDGSDIVDTGSGADQVQAGGGNDRITTGDGDDEVYGGDGDDTIATGSGRDYVDGQFGDDVVRAGDDTDIVYGLSGNDRLYGGAGQDYLEGAKGDDIVDGGAGNDVVSGGRGNDRLYGGEGRDVLYAGHGIDRVEGGTRTDGEVAYVQAEDSVSGNTKAERVDIADASFIQVRGTDEYEERVEADLDLFAASPTGRQMIIELGDEVSKTHHDIWPGEREIVIKESDADAGSENDFTKLSMNDSNIRYNPEYGLVHQNKPPSTTLYHELAHSYDYLNDTTKIGPHIDPADPDFRDGKPVPNAERQAVGLPIDPILDGRKGYEIDPDHPIQYTENGLRQEFGWSLREQYGSPTK